jgi:hypothetical protein
VDTTCGGEGPSCEDVKSQFFTNPQAMLVRMGVAELNLEGGKMRKLKRWGWAQGGKLQ